LNCDLEEPTLKAKIHALLDSNRALDKSMDEVRSEKSHLIQTGWLSTKRRMRVGKSLA
jgi:hypothetical protein